ncbi:MAG: extracellular solute-binding protein [Bacteroidota bacterium]
MNSGKFRIAVRKYAPFETALDKMWKDFCGRTGCLLQLEAVALDLHPLYDALLKDGGLVNGHWDIALINTDWITEAFTKGALEDLTPYLGNNPPEDFPQGWSESLLGKQRFDGRTMALPFHDGPECLIYRKDLLESPGEKEAFQKKYNRLLYPPRTWEELMQVAEFFNRPEENLYGTTFAAFPDGHNTVFDFCLQLWTRNGELLDNKGKVCVNTPEAQAGMDFYRRALRNHNAIHPDSGNFDSVTSGMAFARGELAAMVNWFSFASMCEVIPESRVKGKVDVAMVPAGPKGKGVSLNAYWMYVIGAGSTKKDLAYQFIHYAVNAKNDRMLTFEGGIGCRKSTWTDPEVNAAVPYYHKLEELHLRARSLPQKDNWAEISKVMDHLVLDVIHTQREVRTILDSAQKQINEIEK